MPETEELLSSRFKLDSNVSDINRILKFESSYNHHYKVSCDPPEGRKWKQKEVPCSSKLSAFDEVVFFRTCFSRRALLVPCQRMKPESILSTLHGSQGAWKTIECMSRHCRRRFRDDSRSSVWPRWKQPQKKKKVLQLFFFVFPISNTQLAVCGQELRKVSVSALWKIKNDYTGWLAFFWGGGHFGLCGNVTHSVENVKNLNKLSDDVHIIISSVHRTRFLVQSWLTLVGFVEHKTVVPFCNDICECEITVYCVGVWAHWGQWNSKAFNLIGFATKLRMSLDWVSLSIQRKVNSRPILTGL